MKKLFILIFSALLIVGIVQSQGVSILSLFSWYQDSGNALQTAFKNKHSNIQVQGRGIVQRILPDDLEGSRHQRFIVKLRTGQTLLIAHNIDLAPRVAPLNTGDAVEFYGEYEWNSKGGIIHWTHHDPNNRHIGGWLKHDGKTYQ